MQQALSWEKNLPGLINVEDAAVAGESLNCWFLETGNCRSVMESRSRWSLSELGGHQLQPAAPSRTGTALRAVWM